MQVRNVVTGAQAARKTDLGALPAWNLDDLYPGMESAEVKTDLDRSLRESETFEAKWKGTLAELLDGPDGAKKLTEAIAEFEALQDVLGRLISYAGLQHALDVSDPKRAKFFGDIREKVTNASIHLLFFPLELNRLDEAKIETAMQAEPALGHYRPWIEDERKERPYQLDDKLEQLFHEKSITGRGAWNRLFDETMASLRFDIDGEELTLEPTLNLLQDSDGDKRRKAAEALVATFRSHLSTFSLVTNTLSKDKEISDRWRGFEDVADSRHMANRVEREVVDALVESVRGAYPQLSHRYYALKARWFGKDVLDYWDRNAPLPKIEQKTYGWTEARDTVLSAYSAFSPEMAKIAEPFFEKGWIDAAVKPGKSPGAFSHPTVPSAHPYVLLNYLGRPRDVMTLAHELGHGVHQVLAAPQGPLMAPTPLTLAETASVFGEMLTFKQLLAKTTDEKARKALLASKVEDMINTVVRQIAFYVFERRIHTARREGELTVEDINGIWKEVQAESLGPAIRLGDGYESFWCYVPHFIHSPFYVYAYAFGDCLVNSLYAIYETSSDGFTEKYFDMLKAGGSKHHSRSCSRPFGLDATDPEFWGMGLGRSSRALIDELEAMEG